jgi:hypothetical protein
VQGNNTQKIESTFVQSAKKQENPEKTLTLRHKIGKME